MRATEDRPAKFDDDDDFEVIEEEDVAGYSQDVHPHPRPSIMARSSWSTFLRRQGTQASPLDGNRQPPVLLDSVRTRAEREMPTPAQIESQGLSSDEVNQAEPTTIESTWQQCAMTNKELLDKINTLSSKVDRIAAVCNHLQTCQQAYDRDMRNLQDQVAQGKLPIERNDKLYDLIKAQVANIAVEIEKRVKADLMVVLENQIAAYRVLYENEIDELRYLQQQQDWEIRRLRQEINHVDDGPSHPASRAARSNDRFEQPGPHISFL